MDTVIKQESCRVHVDCKIFAQLDFSLATSEVSLKDYGHIRKLEGQQEYVHLSCVQGTAVVSVATFGVSSWSLNIYCMSELTVV